MQTVMTSVVRMPLRHILLIGLLLLLALTLYLYFGITDVKISALIGGVSGGIGVQIINFMFSMYEYKNIDRFRSLGVLEVLPDRRDRDYYRNIIKTAKMAVQVMGTSCTGFIDDFANTQSDDHVLIDSLDKSRDLTVQFLVPREEHMDRDSRLRYEAGAQRLQALLTKYGRRIELKRFDFQARHSMVRIDNHLIVGPVFQEFESQNAPAIHLDSKSAYAEKYIRYFTWVWTTS